MKNTLSLETREQLKERLALLKKEYAKTVYKLQRAQKAERIQNHVKKPIAHHNRLWEEQSSTQLTTENESSTTLRTNWSNSSLEKSRVPAEESKENNSTVAFNIVPEIIECPNQPLTSGCKNVDSSGQQHTTSDEELNPITKTGSGVQSRLKLRKGKPCEVLKRVCELTYEPGKPLIANGVPCVKKMDALDSINNTGTNVSETLDGCVKENRCHEALPQAEDNTALVKNGTQEVEDNSVILPMGRIESNSLHYCHGDNPIEESAFKNEALPSREMVTVDGQLQEGKPSCSQDISEASESNLKNEGVAVGAGELQSGTAVSESLGAGSLRSCTLVEGLIFPVEYYVRTTRRMTSSQRQIDLDAVIHSQLGKSRNGGKGRPKKLTYNQSSSIEGSPKNEAEICNTLLLFKTQEGDGGEPNATSLQPDLQDSWNIGGDSQGIQSNRRKGGKRGRREGTNVQLTEAHLKSEEKKLNYNRFPNGVPIALSSDVQSENEGKKSGINTCQPTLNSNKLYEKSINNTNSHNFSGNVNFNIKSSSQSQNTAKQQVEPVHNNIQTDNVLKHPLKENMNDLLMAQGESAVCVPEPSSTNSDMDNQEMIPETQQDSIDGISLKKNLNYTRQSFPLGIDLDRGKTESPVSQPKRRVKLSRGNNCRRTRESSRKVVERFQEGALVCSEPLLRVKKTIFTRLFHSQEVQDFDLPEEEYGLLKEKLRAEALKKSRLPSQHQEVGCSLETRAEKDNWDKTHYTNSHASEIKQTTENVEETNPQVSSCCKGLSRTPEKPLDDICPVQQIPKTTSGHKLSSNILLSTLCCTPQAINDHQHDQTAGSPTFPTLGFTPAPGSTECSPVFSQSNYGNQNSPQTGTHMLEGVGNCGQRFQAAAEEVSQTDLCQLTPIIKEGSQCVFSGKEPLNNKDEEDLNYKYEKIFSQQEMPNDYCVEEFSEIDTAIEEHKDDVLTPSLATMQLEQKVEKQLLQLISKIQNPSTSCIIDLCTVFWMVKETRTLCIACACETAVLLWAPEQVNQWTNIYTWVFDKVPIIELIPIPDAVNILCVAFGSLEIREVKVLRSTEQGCLEHTLLQTGDINAVLGLPGWKLVCSCGTLQTQSIEMNTLSKEGRSEQSMQLVPPNEIVLAFSEVEGQIEALIGSTIMSNIVIWNMKTGHLLKRIHLSESYPGTVCQKAYSQSGILFILLSRRYIGTCEGEQVCVLRMVAVNPMNGKSRPIMSYTIPVECSGRYIDGGVKGQSIAAIVTPGTMVLWNLLSGQISTMLQHDSSGDWSLFYWAEEDLCLLARKNDSTVYIYKCLGARPV